MKKLALLALCLFATEAASAKTVSLKTGRWIFDRYRNVDLDNFDYTYLISNVDHGQSTVTLQDGSMWVVTPMQAETVSFYQLKNPLVTPSSITPLDYWESGDTLIFHKVVNRDSLLAYNLTKDLLLDMVPVSSPTNPLLTIASITNTNEVSYYYNYNNKTQSLQQYQDNEWRTVIVLSDGSVWEGDPGNHALVSWIVGDPILVSKDTPWWSSNTSILINFRAGKNQSYATPQYRRFGVWNAG